MKVRICREPGLLESYVEIHCSVENREVRRIADYIERGSGKLPGKYDGKIRLIHLDEIFYFESVDKKTFAYLKDSVWEVECSLKEAEEHFAASGFVRISKSTVINLCKADQLKNDFEMRVLIAMENGETLVMNRHYRKNFQECLETMKRNLMGGAYENHSEG